jgi:opacity protein-like surface antigen
MRDCSPVPLRSLALLLSFVLAAAFSAQAQSLGKTDVAASIYGAFTGTSEGNGTIQSPSNSAGGLLELRHISNPFVGYELNYSFNRANQSYNFTSVKADAHEVGADWIVSVPILSFRPFVLAGAGVLYFHPDSNQPGTSGQTKPVYVYGGGVDWTVIPHFGLRGQFRGNLYHAPDLLAAASSTRAFAHTSEPMIGAYFRF